MTYTYQIVTCPDTGANIQRIEDNAWIPPDSGNGDYRMYLTWVSGGHSPTIVPYVSPGNAPIYSTAIAATQAQAEGATATNVFMTPLVTQNHPAVAKVWVSFSSAGAIESSYNIASVVKNSTGLWTISYTVPFSSASYNPIFTAELTIAALLSAGVKAGTKLAGSIQVSSATLLGILADPSGKLYFAAYGDQ